MIQKPLKVGGKPVDSMSLLQEAIRRNKKVDMTELAEQWDALLGLFRTEVYLGEAEKNRFFQYVMEKTKENGILSDMGSMKQDILEGFPEYVPASEEDFKNAVARIRKYLCGAERPEEGTLEKEAYICAENIQVIFHQIRESRIKDEVKQWMFYIMAALYCRIGISFKECPADMDGYARYMNKADTGMKTEMFARNHLKNNKGRIPFMPLEDGNAYPILTAGWENQEKEGGIRLCTLYNGMDRDRGTVILRIQSEDGIPQGYIKMNSREYVHAVVTGTGKLLYVLPSISVNNGQCILRPGNGRSSLFLFGKDGECLKKWSGKKCEEITGFAADGSGGFLAVRNGSVDCEYLEDDALYRNSRLRWAISRKMEVLDVWIEKGFFYLLKKDGGIFTDAEQKPVDIRTTRKIIPEKQMRFGKNSMACLTDRAEGYMILKD